MAVERRRYRKVLTRMHGDEKYRELSKPKPNGQTLWQYLITGPHTTAVPGLFTAGEAGMAEALEWPLAGFRRAWKEIESREMAHADWRARVVWLPNAVRHNVPESPNVVRSWRTTLDEIPECTLKTRALIDLAAFLEGYGPAFLRRGEGHHIAGRADRAVRFDPRNRLLVCALDHERLELNKLFILATAKQMFVCEENRKSYINADKKLKFQEAK
jgi:hypothetical protein